MFKKFTEWRLSAGAKKKTTMIRAAVILVLVLLVMGVYSSLATGGQKNFGRLSNWADFTKYQAVFLTNGQVYFGKVTDANQETLVLENIYYLRTAGNPQTSEEEPSVNAPAADNFSLIKLGQEIHGPEDRMSINLSQVLFVENLKNDSKVVEAIRAYESK